MQQLKEMVSEKREKVGPGTQYRHISARVIGISRTGTEYEFKH